MIRLLSRIFIPNRDDIYSPDVRQAYGMLSGAVGILFNALLCVGKLFAGVISGSIAITADALNNLSDAGSSVITLIGFKLAGKRPDPDHPFGHGRAEYITGLIISIVIILMGLELLKSSVEKILSPEAVEFSWLAVGILLVSILVKIYMWYYNRSLSKKLNSPAMAATATDSLSDTIATSAVLLGMITGRLTGWTVDGWCGVIVSVFILTAGYSAAKDTIAPLLGRTPDKEFIDDIEREVMSYPDIIGIHDLIVHDYGPGRQMISLHAEVPADGDMMQLHDTIDLAERSLHDKLNCAAVIHMDPVEKDNPIIAELKLELLTMLRGHLGDSVNIHDFRMVPGPTHTNLIFDVLIPHDCPLSEMAVSRMTQQFVEHMDGNYYAVVQIDRAYV
ncbi:MAG: cation diffusion facilitator family transporter [Clostridia bacterium]|nr:cation diffusion facilitator family transporter [Clostridia bacterium]